MIGISLKRPVTVGMFVAALLVFGIISFQRLGRDLLPDIAYPSLTVMTRYDGAAPQEVEEFITKGLESSLSTVKGKRRLQSMSRESLSLITIEFEWGHDMQIATLHVREKLDQARFRDGFPQDADRPNILRWDPSSKPVVGLAITGDSTILQLKESVRDIIKPRLEQLEGIAYAQIAGDIERVIDIEVDRDKLALYGIDLKTISDAIGRANANVPGGTIKKGRYRYSLRTLGEFGSVEEMNQVVIGRRNGSDIMVADVARVLDTAKDRDAMATVNGEEAIGLLIYKEAGANTIAATKLVRELVDELAETNQEYGITLAFEEAKFIEQALNNVWVSLIFGGFFAFIVLVLFLRDLRSPIFVFISIPIAIITTLVLMYFSDISLNIMSLGGLALGVGMLVDNSIVVLENVYRYREMGNSPMDAAYKGAREVAMPVAASTLTTIAVFFPIVYLQGVAGALFGEQALTVTYSLVSSLVVSLTVLPLLTALATILHARDSTPVKVPALPKFDAERYPRGLVFWKWWEFVIAALVIFFVAAFFKVEWRHSFAIIGGVALFPVVLYLLKLFFTFFLSWLIQSVLAGGGLTVKGILWCLNHILLPVFDTFYNAFDRAYHHALMWCLDRKLIALSLALGLLTVALFVGNDLKRELMPKSATGQFTIEAKLPPGTALEITGEVVENIETLLKQDEAVDVVFSQIGASEANLAQLLRDSGTNTAELSVKLKDEFVSLAQVYRLADKVREAGKSVNGLSISVKESESSFEDLLQSEGGSGLVVQVEGEFFDDLYRANDDVFALMQSIEGLKDVKTSLVRDFPQMEIRLNREAIERYELTIGDIGNYLSGGMRGELATNYKEFDRSIDVRVRFSEADRENFERVLAATIATPKGTAVPLRDLLFVDVIRGTKEIRRVNQRRVAVLSASLEGRKISEVIPQLQAGLDNLSLPRGVIAIISGEQAGIRDSFGQLLTALILSALLVYMIMAGQFESLRLPMVVILTLPMGLIGTIFMLYLFDQSVNIMSLIGLIVLSGIVVNDAIVKVDFINQARSEGSNLREAVVKASHVRLRPILMTTATTVLGLVPMASGLVPSVMGSAPIRPLVAALDSQLVKLGTTPLSELFSSRGAEIQQPLALVVIGGLSLATLLTLMLIPLLYEMFAGVREARPKKEPTGIAGITGQPEGEPT